jgi:hypothetical protein
LKDFDYAHMLLEEKQSHFKSSLNKILSEYGLHVHDINAIGEHINGTWIKDIEITFALTRTV